MTTAADFLAGVKPSTDFFKIVSGKKPLLNRMVADIESSTGVAYPPLYLHYPLLMEEDGGITRAVIVARWVIGRRNIIEHVVYVTGFTLLNFDEDTIRGILIEEFLHYAYRSKLMLKRERIRKLPDKQMLEPLEDWFSNPTDKARFGLAQTSPRLEDYRAKVADWNKKGYPIRPASTLSGADIEGRIVDASVPSDIALALAAKGKMQDAIPSDGSK